MKILFIVLLFCLLICCSNKNERLNSPDNINKVYYFVFEEPWLYSEYPRTIFYSYTYPADSTEIRRKRKIIQNIRQRDTSFAKNSLFLDSVEFCGSTYQFVHNFDKDTVFVKKATILDSTKYYDATFFNDEKRVSKFFGRHFSSKPDTLEIYMIEQTADSDSVIFRRVNRYMMPYL